MLALSTLNKIQHSTRNDEMVSDSLNSSGIVVKFTIAKNPNNTYLVCGETKQVSFIETNLRISQVPTILQQAIKDSVTVIENAKQQTKQDIIKYQNYLLSLEFQVFLMGTPSEFETIAFLQDNAFGINIAKRREYQFALLVSEYEVMYNSMGTNEKLKDITKLESMLTEKGKFFGYGTFKDVCKQATKESNNNLVDKMRERLGRTIEVENMIKLVYETYRTVKAQYTSIAIKAGQSNNTLSYRIFYPIAKRTVKKEGIKKGVRYTHIKAYASTTLNREAKKAIRLYSAIEACKVWRGNTNQLYLVMKELLDNEVLAQKAIRLSTVN